jgi:uncharacterized protein YndB with AHSA1/START domain
MARTIAVERTIHAPPDTIWALVADLPRMGEWSPENTGGRWLKGADGPAVGAGFKGTNANGRRRWSTRATVTVCQPGQAFGFDVKAGGLTVGTWRYDIESSDGGCRVTESFSDTRGWLVKTLGGMISGVTDRDTHNRAGMETTLANLAASVEADA